MSTYSFDLSNQSSATTPIKPSSHATTPPSVQIPNPEYFAPAVVTTGEEFRDNLFENMRSNPAFQPPPLSPRTALQIVEGPHDVGLVLVTNIAKGLAATLERCDQAYAEEKDRLQDRIRGLEDKVEHYKATFVHPPEGYVENNDHYPSLTIPVSHGLFRPAKWIKQLDSGRVAMLSAQDGPNTEPYITDIYASPIYGSSPAEPMPYWFQDLLTRPSTLFLTLRDAIADLDDWGILADVLRFRSLDEQVSKVHSDIAILEAKLEGLRLA